MHPVLAVSIQEFRCFQSANIVFLDGEDNNVDPWTWVYDFNNVNTDYKTYSMVSYGQYNLSSCKFFFSFVTLSLLTILISGDIN